jgi:hypothetical protein
MSVVLLSSVERSDDLDENLLEVVFVVAIAKFGERTFGEELAGLDDADDVAELFDFAHDVGGEDDGLAALAALANEIDDGASGHNVEAESRLVKDHDLGVVDEGACYGSFLLHAGRKFVAPTVAEGIHVEASEDIVDAFFQAGFIETVEAPEVFDHFLRSEARVESRGGREKADIGANFFGSIDDVMTANGSGAVSWLENGGEHTESGGFARSVGAEQAVNLARFAGKGDVIDGANLAALLILKDLSKATRFNHGTSSQKRRVERQQGRC